MLKQDLYRAETTKSNMHFIEDFQQIASDNGFTIHNSDTMDMHRSFGQHGIQVHDNFDLHMMQICKPEKAAKSLSANPERAILMPKFVITFSDKGKTQIRFMRYNREDIKNVVQDGLFPDSLAETYNKIIAMIEQAIN